MSAGAKGGLKPGQKAEPKLERKFITVPTAADWLGLSEPTIRRMLTQKVLRRYKVGQRTLLLIDEVQALVKEAK